MNPPPPFGPPGYRSQAPLPSYAPSREAMEAERLAREARERRQANDQFVITVYRVCGAIGVGIALLMIVVSVKSGGRGLAGRILLRSILFGGGGVGAFLRGNMLARRSREPIVPDYAQMQMPMPPPFQAPPAPQQPPTPGQITRWTE